MNIVTPKIELIASTVVDAGTFQLDEDTLDITGDLLGMDIQLGSTDAETLMTYAGRGCYEAWHRPNQATYEDADYLKRTALDMAHGSILEHANITLRFSGVSRAWLMEMERHRHLSWSVVSQRYVDANTFGVVVPPAIREATGRIVYDSEATYDDLEGPVSEALEWWARDAMYHYAALVEHLQNNGLPRKQAREAARSILPNCTEVRGVVTGNVRAWANIIPLRAAAGADAEMQEVTRMILDVVEPVAPSIFQEVKASLD